MWLRIITVMGDSLCIVIPSQIVKILQWKRSEHIQFQVINNNQVLLTRVQLSHVSDKMLETTKEMPTIK